MSLSNVVSLVGSEILFAELSLISEVSKKDAVVDLIAYLVKESIKLNKEIENLAEKINFNCKIGDYADALHLAFAAHSEVVYFISCDTELLKKSNSIEQFLKSQGYALSIVNPIQFLKKEGVV